MKSQLVTFFVTTWFGAILQGQSIRITTTASTAYPLPVIDGNSPGVWVDGTLRVNTSTGDPLAMTGPDLFNLRNDPALRLQKLGEIDEATGVARR